jgi:hypothetical protein
VPSAGARIVALCISAAAAMVLVNVELAQGRAATPEVLSAAADRLTDAPLDAPPEDARVRLAARVSAATHAAAAAPPWNVAGPAALASAGGVRGGAQAAVASGLVTLAHVAGAKALLAESPVVKAEAMAQAPAPARAHAPAPTHTDAPRPELVMVPDVDGDSVVEAHRALRAAGVRVSVRDEFGNGVPRDEWRGLKVIRQSVGLGGTTPRGSWVHVTVAYGRRRLVQGY